MLEKATTKKDLKEYHMSTTIYISVGISKFTYRILNQKPPEGFKQPDLPNYDATTGYPSDHIQNFEKQLIMYDIDVLKCKLSQ